MSAMPATIGKYVVHGEIGRGASSTVYLAHDGFHDRQVAIKQIHAHLLTDAQQDRRYRRYLQQEAAVYGQLNHPHIVRLFDADAQAHPPYLVLEYVPGQSLASFTTPDKLLPVARVLDIAFKCCGALQHAHERGLVHRDIKPANLMLKADGSVMVTDFGTALSVHSQETQLSGLVGSPAYMSPEQVGERDCTHQSDMFSLAVVVYELLTGRRAFEGQSDYAILYKIGNETPSAPSLLRAGLPPKLDNVLMRALARRPEDRYAEWPEFASALLELNRQLPTRAPQEREGERFAQLRALPFFAQFHDAALWQTLRLGTLTSYPRGTVLMREETSGNSFCVIVEGQVAVTRHGWKLSTLGPGVALGEMSYLRPARSKRSATAVAETDVLALEIRNEALRKAPEELQTRFDKAFIDVLVDRLVDTTKQVGMWDSVPPTGAEPGRA